MSCERGFDVGVSSASPHAPQRLGTMVSDPLKNTPAGLASELGLAMLNQAVQYPGRLLRGDSVAQIETENDAQLQVIYQRWLTHDAGCRCGRCPTGCDCPLDPHHRWNCSLTPIWAQTIRDLDTNPWTVTDGPRRELADLNPNRIGINRFMFDGHDGKCSM